MSKGKVIVLEGLDGCGKSTQLALAEKLLRELVSEVRAVSFPNYDSPSGAIITEYLHGGIPCDGENGAYAASSFYAVDRYMSFAKDWKADYERGAVILSGRYATSNAIYQMTKLPVEKRREYLAWLEDYEYEKLGLPKPDLVIFLDMPLSASQKLLSKRYEGDESKKDIHESDLAFMKACADSAETAAEYWGWKRVPCAENGEPLPIEVIGGKIAELIRKAVSA